MRPAIHRCLAAVLALAVLAVPAGAAPPEVPVTHKAYLYVEARLTDPERFAEYARRMQALVPASGGRYVVMRGEREALEGELGDVRIVISEWPSMAAARHFWNSPEYAAVRQLRAGTGTFRVLLLESLDEGPAP